MNNNNFYNNEEVFWHDPIAVDCVIIFMLDEERDTFLNFNNRFILSSKTGSNFQEFFFIDKENKLRRGVICSDGNNMGNYAASALFYKLSRRYKASLYINVGVAGRLDDINIGDVVFVDRLSSAGENNANNVTYQLSDAPSYPLIRNRVTTTKDVITGYINGKFCFSRTSVDLLSSFKRNLQDTDGCKIEESEINGIGEKNICRSGWCLSFPEVIKDRNSPDFKEFSSHLRRKSSLVDMEAYYLSEWHNLILNEEPDRSIKQSEFIAIKSVSDCGDTNKPKYEEAGSRILAMNNLAEVVTHFCCESYCFPNEPAKGESIGSVIDSVVSEKSVIRTVKEMFVQCADEATRLELIKQFEEMFKFFIRVNCSLDLSLDELANIRFSFLENALFNYRSIIKINGRSGTGKTTFLAFLYNYFKIKNIPVIYWEIPFFSSVSDPSPRQIIYFISRLLEENNSIVLILDGLRALSFDQKTYEAFSELIKKRPKHLCVAYGDIDESSEKVMPLFDNIAENTLDLLFGGVCIDADQFETLLDAAILFFRNVHRNNLSKGSIKSLLKSSNGQAKVINVDYLLMFMLSEQSILLQQKKYRYIYTFINTYLISKYSPIQIKQFVDETITTLITPSDTTNTTQSFEASEMFRYNSYAIGFAYASAVYELFRSYDRMKNDISVFLKKEVFFPFDMSMILQDRLIESQRQQSVGSSVLNSIITCLESRNEKSVEIETLLVSIVSNLTNKDLLFSPRIKQLIIHRQESIKHNLQTADSKLTRKLNLQLMIYQRVLSRFFGMHEGLAEFNEKLLMDNNLSLVNLIFNLFYYSRRLFSFEDILSFSLNNVYDEMFYNTYYVLEKTIINEYASKMSPQFLLYNIITYLQLYKLVVLPTGNYKHISTNVKKICDTFNRVCSSFFPNSFSFYHHLMALMDETLQ